MGSIKGVSRSWSASAKTQDTMTKIINTKNLGLNGRVLA
jgi:hypothetical protein